MLYHKPKEKETKNELLKQNANTTRKKISSIYIDRASFYVAASRCVKQSGLKLIGK